MEWLLENYKSIKNAEEIFEAETTLLKFASTTNDNEYDLEEQEREALRRFLVLFAEHNVSLKELDEWIINPTNEGIIGSVLGGITGFALGKAIGKTFSKVLGVEKGILYDLFTSRLVGTAMGSAIGKRII
jgi:hypothetical protein